MSPHTSLGDLHGFREDHHDELTRYRRAVRRLARQVGGIEDPEELAHELRQIVRDDINPAQEEVGAKLQENGFVTGLTVAETTVPAVAGFAASGFKGLWTALAGLGIGLAFSMCRHRIAAERLRREPFAYLWHARQHFATDEDTPLDE